MVTITINGKKKDREFMNMAQALAFAYQNGECHNAEKIEIAYASAGSKSGKADTGDKTPPAPPSTGSKPEDRKDAVAAGEKN